MITIEAHALQQRDDAYHERNMLVQALTKLWPSHLTKHSEMDLDWDPEWLNIVCVHSPMGQLTWHIHERELPMFDHLALWPNDWDGHSTNEKYDRLQRLEQQWKREDWGKQP